MIPSDGFSGTWGSRRAFYALAFPQARIQFFILRRPLRTSQGDLPGVFWLAIPVRYVAACWLLIQLSTLRNQLDGRTHVSAAAHLGGFVVGLAAWWWFATARVRVHSRP